MAPESGTVVMPVERFRQAIWLGLDDAAHRLTWEEDRGLIAAARASSGNGPRPGFDIAHSALERGRMIRIEAAWTVGGEAQRLPDALLTLYRRARL